MNDWNRNAIYVEYVVLELGMENDKYILNDVDFGHLSFGLGTILLFLENVFLSM
jgi:hypothetical protein